MGHSGDFARWPHLGPIRPMDGGGHLGPLSYVYGYRGGVGRRGVGQDTTRDDGIKIDGLIIKMLKTNNFRCPSRSAHFQVRGGRQYIHFWAALGESGADLLGFELHFSLFAKSPLAPPRSCFFSKKKHTKKALTDIKIIKYALPVVYFDAPRSLTHYNRL